MKAIVYTRYGSPDVLQFKEVEKSVPEDDEVLIKVHATTVNRTDCATIKAVPFFMRIVTGLLIWVQVPMPNTWQFRKIKSF